MVVVSGVQGSDNVQDISNQGVTPSSEERGFSPLKYLLVATVVGGIAPAIFPFCMPAAAVLMVISGWYLYSAAIVVFNKHTDSHVVHWLHALAMEVNSGVRAAFLFPLTLFSSYHEGKGDANEVPILMVNGYLGFGSGWHDLREGLIEKGHGPIYTINVGSFDSLDQYADEVKERIERIAEETGKNEISLVCHSKGGLVSTLCAKKMQGSVIKIKHLITIGSPFNGTPLAKIGPGKDAGGMTPGSNETKTIQEFIKNNPDLPMYHIASETDEVVPLASATPIQDPSRRRVYNDLGHLGLVSSTRVLDDIHKWLSDRKITELSIVC